MSKLSELFDGIGLQSDTEGLFSNPAVKRILDGIASNVGGISVAPADPAPQEAQTREVASVMDQGQPYTPLTTATTQAAPNSSNVAPRQPKELSALDQMANFMAGMGKGGGALIPAIGEGIRATSAAEKGQQTENATVKLFMDNGLDEQTALAASRNPAVQQALLSSLVPAKSGPFDLASGAARFDGKGNLIARNDQAKPAPFRLGPGQKQFDEKGNLIAENTDAKPGRNEFGLNPQYVRGPDGKVRLMQVAKDATGQLTSMPEGYEVLPPTATVDLGTSTAIIGKHGGGSVGTLTKDVAGEAQGKKFGQERGEQLAAKPQATLALNGALSKLEKLEAEANAISSDKNLWRSTGLVGAFPSMPGGDAANLDAKIDTIKTKVGFEVLQAMRDASKTGGALGAISDRENAMLQNALTTLQTKQHPDQFKKAMDDIVTFARESRDRLRKAYNDTYGGEADATSVVEEAKDAIARGADRNAVIQRMISRGINPPPGL